MHDKITNMTTSIYTLLVVVEISHRESHTLFTLTSVNITRYIAVMNVTLGITTEIKSNLSYLGP